MMTRVLTPKLEFWDGAPTAEYRHELLFMIDEFPALGKMPMIEGTLAYAAGYGLKYYLISQDLNQLRDRDAYGPQEKITAGCQVQNAYAPNLRETAEYFSALCGETTYIERRISKTMGGGLGATRQKTLSLDATGRPLLKPDEVIALDRGQRSPDGKLILDGGKMLIKPAAGPMIMGKQLIYAQHPLYGPRAKVPRMPVYPLIRVRYYSANPRYKDGAIAEDGVFLRYDDAGQIIKSVGWDMALSPPQRVVETLADDQLDQLGVAPHEADRLAFRRHRFSESIARPAVRFDELGVDAAGGCAPHRRGPRAPRLRASGHRHAHDPACLPGRSVAEPSPFAGGRRHPVRDRGRVRAPSSRTPHSGRSPTPGTCRTRTRPPSSDDQSACSS